MNTEAGRAHPPTQGEQATPHGTRYLKARSAGNGTFYELRQISRFYEDNLGHLRKCKVSFNEALDIVFPGYRRVFQDVYYKIALETLKKYPHPEMIANKKPQKNAKYDE